MVKPNTKNVNTVNISFHAALLGSIDRVAKQEARSRSELIREAARAYIERKQRMQDIFKLGESLAKANDLKPDQIDGEIRAYRQSRKSKTHS